MTLSKISLFLLFVISFTGNALPTVKIPVINKLDGQTIGDLESVKAGRNYYISLQNFSDILQLSYTVDKVGKEYRLAIGGKSIHFRALSPFIKIDGEYKQIPLNVLYKNDIFYVPLGLFVDVLANNLPYQIEYNRYQKELYISKSTNIDILRVNIDDLANGSIIKIFTSAGIDRSNIFASESNGWLYIDFYGGNINHSTDISIHNHSSTIKKVIPIELSSETSRLSFKTNSMVKEKEILVKENPPHIFISLRTREKLSNDILQELEKERQKWKIDVIIIDPGHGGKDPGAVGKTGSYEKQIVLDIALILKKEIEERLGIKVLLTRDSDRFIPLKKRTKYANENGGKLFISIHADANKSRRLRGHTVYFLGAAKTEKARKAAQFENSVIKFEESTDHYKDFSDLSFILGANAQNAYHKESQDFAAIIDKELKTMCDSKSHGVRQAEFYVLYGVSMPNILLETAFISNRWDEKRLSSRSYRRDIAKALCNGVVEFKNKYEAAY